MELSSDSEIDDYCDVNSKVLKRCPCDTDKPRSNYPASIMRDMSVCKIKNKFTYNNVVDTDNPLHAVMKQLVYHTSMFNYAEDIYNKNNEYYFGELPYIIEQKILNYIKTQNSSDDFVNYIENEVILPYLSKMYNLDYTNSDFNKIQLLIIFIIMSMSSNSNQDLFNQIMDCYNDLTKYYNINYLYGNNLYNVDLNRDGKFTNANIKNILAAVYNMFSNDCDKYNKYSDEYSKCIYDGMTIRKDPTCNLILSYLGWSDETGTFDVSQIDNHNQKLLVHTQQKFDKLYKQCIDYYLHAFNKKYIKINYNTTFYAIAQEDINTTQTIIKSTSDLYNNILTKSVLKNYFYTSLLMYKRFQLPPIKSNDDGNGRLSEYLLSNVYHNYGIYLYTNGNIDTDNVTPAMIDEYKNIYNITANTSTYYMLNIRALCLLYIKHFCRDGIFTKRLLNHEDPECKVIFNQGYNIYADVYNKINIDNDYVLVKLNDVVNVNYIYDLFGMLDGRVQAETDIEILHRIITIFKQFVIIFAPLRPLTNYYSTMENANVDRRWFNKNLNIYNEDLSINNDSGGDLYCAQGDDFYLFDSKRYNNFDDCYKVKTLVQSWMYMNVYWKPLCCIYNNDITVNKKVGKNFELYKNYYLGFINPLRNDISACTYNSMNMYLNNKNNKYYLDDTCNCKYSAYLKNNYKFVQQKDNDDYLENIRSIQWNIDNYNRNRIQKQINLRSCKPMDLIQLENQYCSNENSPACLIYKELISKKCKNVDQSVKPVTSTFEKKNKRVTSHKNKVVSKPVVVDNQEINDEINKYSKCKHVNNNCRAGVIIMNTKYCSNENSPDCMKYRNIMSSRLNNDLKDSILQKSYEIYKNEKIRTLGRRKRFHFDTKLI